MEHYILDDTSTISEEIKKMSEEEQHQLARKLEEEVIRENHSKRKQKNFNGNLNFDII